MFFTRKNAVFMRLLAFRKRLLISTMERRRIIIIMRQEKYDRLKKMYDSKHFEDVCADAIEAVNAEKKISDLGKEIAETQQRLISIIGGLKVMPT